jgi:glycine/D-amino acid oxidase-like deaminating enzyme
MRQHDEGRRRFLAGLAVLGLTPVTSRLEALRLLDTTARQDVPRVFTGDDIERAHELLMDPNAVLASRAPREVDDLHDVIVVGGGISGLAVTWLLRDRKVLLLERDKAMGGVSQSAEWRGLQYCIGAAYIIDPDPDSEDDRERRTFGMLEELGLRARGEDLRRDRTRQRRISGDGNHCIFSNRRVVPEAEVYTARNNAFFEHVLDSDNYPAVPASDHELVQALDRVSFSAFLKDAALQRKFYGRSVGPISPFGWEAIEYYFWGAFGTTPAETSAYHGLNFFAAEYGSVLVYPGGNGFITRRLAERIASSPTVQQRNDAWVLRVEPDGANGTVRVTAMEGNSLVRYRARRVVYASPMFLAPRIVPSLPDEQQKAIASLGYRGYLVANVFLNRTVDKVFAHPAFRNGYELTRIHGVDPVKEGTQSLSGRKSFSDVVVADFPVWRHATGAILTVYRPYPYDDGRMELMSKTYEDLENEVRAAVLEGFGRHGLRQADIDGIALSRWGHPMIVPRPGQLADGTMARVSKRHGAILFAHTDTQGAPAFENAMAGAIETADVLRKEL